MWASNIYISGGSYKDPFIVITDYDHKKRYYNDLKYRVENNELYVKARGTLQWCKMYVSHDKNRIKFIVQNKKQQNKVISTIYFKTNTGGDKSFNRSYELTLVKPTQFFNYVDTLLTNHDIDSGSTKNIAWYGSSGEEKLNSNGEITFEVQKNGFSAEAQIDGKFKKGVLTNQGVLRLRIYKCYKQGLISCKISKVEKTTIKIKPKSNVGKIIDDFANKKLPEMGRQASVEIRKLADSKSYTASASTNPSFCGANDTCFKVVRYKKSTGSAIVQCTKGSYKGQEKCLSYNKSNGKFGTGCGLSDIVGRTHTLEKAGNRACGQ